MKIGIDARLINETGVGRYIKNLVVYLSMIDKTNEYIIFLGKEAYEHFEIPNERWQKRLLTVRWHTLKEQIILPFVFGKEHLDLVHIPYFTVPIFYPGKIISTIHDLIILHISTGKASTLPYPLYLLRKVGYALVLRIGVFRATRIIAVSETTKKEIRKFLHVPEEKILVTYEGIDTAFLTVSPQKPDIADPYFLYVGNVYPHKQAEFLYTAFCNALEHSDQFRKDNVKMIFVGKKDFFYDRFLKKVHEEKHDDSVLFMHNVNDKVLAGLYAHAVALVFPSKMEGFGLPPLEAISQGCRVLVSDIPVFHELLESYATFIPLERDKWEEKLQMVYLDKNQKKLDKDTISRFVRRFSWEKMAERTIQIYEDCVRL